MALWEFRLETGVGEEVVRLLVEARTEEHAKRMLTQAVAHAARQEISAIRLSDGALQEE